LPKLRERSTIDNVEERKYSMMGYGFDDEERLTR
jgi:hypothetical protein